MCQCYWGIIKAVLFWGVLSQPAAPNWSFSLPCLSTVGGMQWNEIALLRGAQGKCTPLSVWCFLIQGLIQFPVAACVGTSGAGVNPPSVCLITAGSPENTEPNTSHWLLMRPRSPEPEERLYLLECVALCSCSLVMTRHFQVRSQSCG